MSFTFLSKFQISRWQRIEHSTGVLPRIKFSLSWGWSFQEQWDKPPVRKHGGVRRYYTSTGPKTTERRKMLVNTDPLAQDSSSGINYYYSFHISTCLYPSNLLRIWDEKGRRVLSDWLLCLTDGIAPMSLSYSGLTACKLKIGLRRTPENRPRGKSESGQNFGFFDKHLLGSNLVQSGQDLRNFWKQLMPESGQVWEILVG